MRKKIWLFIIGAVIAGTGLMAPATAAPSSTGANSGNSGSGNGNSSSDRSVLGMVPWDYGVDLNNVKDDNLGSAITMIVLNIANDLTVLAAYLAIIFIIYGGYKYLFSGGDPGKVTEGRKTLSMALIGFGIVMLANIIFAAMRYVLGSANAEKASVTIGSEQIAIIKTDIDLMVLNAIQWVIGVVGLVAAIFVVYGGIGFMTSAGDPGKLSKARRTIMYSMIGMVIVAAAFGIVGFAADSAQRSGAGSNADISNISGGGGSSGGNGQVTSVRAADRTKLVKGQNVVVKASVIPHNAKNQKLNFKSSDESVASVDSIGGILAKKVGKTIVTVSSPDGPKKDMEVTVVDITPVSSIKLSDNKVTVRKNQSVYISTTILPENATDKTLTWVSDNPDVAVVTQEGRIQGVKVGKANITVRAANNASKIAEAKIKVTVTTGAVASKTAETLGDMRGVEYSGKLRMRKETRKIVDDHRRDFYHYNFRTKIQEYGGYRKYVKNLGGIFGELYDTRKVKVKTAADIQLVAEYVWGLFTIWGPDYGNGKTHHMWRLDRSWDGGKNDGFYHGESGRGTLRDSTRRHIDDMLSSSTLLRTNCNYAINTFYKKLRLRRLGGTGGGKKEHIEMSLVGKIKKVNELQVGDIVHFFNPGGGWHHVALVGEVYKDYVILYDGGGRFIKEGRYKQKTKRTNSSKLTDDYDGETNWWAFRPWKIDQSVTLKGIN